MRFAWELKAKQKNKEYIRFNAGKEDREVNFETVNLENVMFEEREKSYKKWKENYYEPNQKTYKLYETVNR